MKTKILLLVGTSVLFFNCKKEMKTVEEKTDSIATVADSTLVEMHNSQNALDWQGTYKGTTPCASCEGIETEITLSNDLTFVIKTKYLGKGDGKIFEEKGTLTWNETGSIVVLNDLKEQPNQFKVGENTLTQLDMNGAIITGELAAMYILKK